jgi:hypothetical protein
VNLDGTLSGPTPWHFAGEACLSTWFGDLCVSFDATFGREETVELPEQDVWPLLRTAIENPANWGSAMPEGAARAVVTAPPVDEEGAPRIDPASALTVRQKVVPLNRRIERFAQVVPGDFDRFQVSGVELGGMPLPAFDPVEDWFAPAQFEALSDDEKLSRPGYERMVAGVTLATAQVSVGSQLNRNLEYETIVFPAPEPLPGFYQPPFSQQVLAVATSATANAPLQQDSGRGGVFAPPRGAQPMVVLEEETFVIASTADLVPRLDLIQASTRGAAELALKEYLATNPSARGTLQVVPRFEVEDLLP